MSPFLSFAYEGYNPGGPDGIVLDWFHDWLVTADATTGTDWYIPLYVSRERAFEWHYRFRRLLSEFSLTSDAFTWTYNENMTRRFTVSSVEVDSEEDLRKPGIIASDTYGTPANAPTTYNLGINDDGWNGPGSTLELQITVDLFRKQRRTVDGVDVDVPHMVWQQDGDLIIPSLVVTGSLTLTTPGTELSWVFTTENIDTPAYTDTVSVFPSHGGSGIDLNFSSATVEPDAFSLTISPNLWFAWDRFDPATGAEV